MANILINKITSITINIGLINLAPFLSAILDPKIFPAMPNTAAGRPICHNIFPFTANVINAATFEARFTSFALPEDVRRSKLAKAENAIIRNVPFPGPKKPS